MQITNYPVTYIASDTGYAITVLFKEFNFNYGDMVHTQSTDYAKGIKNRLCPVNSLLSTLMLDIRP